MKALDLCRVIAEAIGGCEPTCTVGGSYETSIGDWGLVGQPAHAKRYLAVMVDADADGNALCIAVSGQLDHPDCETRDLPYSASTQKLYAALRSLSDFSRSSCPSK